MAAQKRSRYHAYEMFFTEGKQQFPNKRNGENRAVPLYPARCTGVGSPPASPLEYDQAVQIEAGTPFVTEIICQRRLL